MRPVTTTGSITPSSSSHAGHIQSLGARPNIGAAAQPLIVTTGVADPDGFNHWWAYEEDTLGGVGKYTVNVASGNLMTQSDDMAVPNKGIEFAFQRTYNSMSNHTYANGDGSTPSLYGDKWTNTFDAHIAYNDFTPINGQKGVSLYDIDGARYDYAPVGDGHSFTPPAGQFAILYYDGSGYSWTKTTGTVYYFWDLNQPTSPALAGLIETIYGRNHNNYLSFARTYTPDASSPTNLVTMTVTGEDGRVATLSYGNVPSNCNPCYRVLGSLTWPDGSSTVNYGYTIQIQGINLIGPELYQVTSPGNGSTSAGTLVEQYSYGSGTEYLSNVYSPRYVCAKILSNCITSADPISSGPAYTFFYGSGNVLSQVAYYGNVNPSITDAGGSGYLQPSATHDLGSSTPYRTVTFSYSSGSTTWSDTDGHQTVYGYDSIGRVTLRTDTTGDPTSGGGSGVATLATAQHWDSNNNLTATIDARGNETDFAYDNNGNSTAVGEPSVTTSMGALRPTTRYTYDSNNNILSYCDAVWNATNGVNWPASYTCPTTYASPGQTINTWSVPGSYEPFGELTTTTSPVNYTTTFAYNIAAQGGSLDYGLPTSATGAQITQVDGSSVTPAQLLTYDSHGNLICYSKANGVTTVGTWVLQYDSLMRLTTLADPDDGSIVSCGKSPGPNTIVTTNTYFSNNQVATNQTPPEAAASVSTSFIYDPDGNETKETHHFGSTTPGITNEYYDGADRLVEVGLPHDSTDWAGPGSATGPWLTRYFYDLAMGHTVTFGTALAFRAYGNIYSTQEYADGAGGWGFLNGNASDALDRPTKRLFYPPAASCSNLWSSCPATVSIESYTYDHTTTTLGYMTVKSDALGETSTFDYDAVGQQASVSFAGDGGVTSPRTYTYDPDGRITKIHQNAFGDQTWTYNADGTVATSSEPQSGSYFTDPAKLTYQYYGNGWRSSLSADKLGNQGLVQANLFTYDYRADGLLVKHVMNYGSNAFTFMHSYTAAGRRLGTTDPYGSKALTYDARGQLSSLTLPEGQLINYTHDPEGQLANFTGYGVNVTTSYNNRGELVSQYFGPPTQFANSVYAKASILQQGVHGAMSAAFYACQPSLAGATPQPKPLSPCTWGWDNYGPLIDMRNAAIGFDGFNTNYNYDNAGRHVQTKNGTYQAVSKTYDAENHQITQCGAFKQPKSFYTMSFRYSWGPSGHPLNVGASPWAVGEGSCNPTISYESVHWDGDTILFTTNAQGAVDDIKMGLLADYTPIDSVYKGLTIFDRDPSGFAVGMHNSIGHGPLSAPQPMKQGYNFTDACFAQAPAGFCGINQSVGNGALLLLPASDGFWDEFNKIQGVRVFDPELGAWTSPDEFPGIVEAPMTQKAYTWDDNNPISNADPSGLCSGCQSAWGDASFGGLDVYGHGPHNDGGTGATSRALPSTVSGGPICLVCQVPWIIPPIVGASHRVEAAYWYAAITSSLEYAPNYHGFDKHGGKIPGAIEDDWKLWEGLTTRFGRRVVNKGHTNRAIAVEKQFLTEAFRPKNPRYDYFIVIFRGQTNKILTSYPTTLKYIVQSLGGFAK